MKTDEKRPPRDEKLQQLRRELLERIVRNESRRRAEQNAPLRCVTTPWDSPTGLAGQNG